MTPHLMRRNSLLIPFVFAALTGCQDSITNTTAPRETLKPRFSAFPGSNGKIAYSGPGGGIHTIDPDGSGAVALTSDGAGPAWSPDGTKLAFYSSLDGNNEIYVMNADGSGTTQLTFTTSTVLRNPSWSPDGSKIVFENDSDGKIYVMDSDGSDITALSSGPDGWPSWSPDGTRIAFASVRDAGQFEIYVMNVDGTNQTRLTNDAASEDYDPGWSPDGSKIVFTHTAISGGLADIYVMSASGAGVTNLTNSSDRDEQMATWSPDGTKIAFINNDGVNVDIHVMNANGTGQTNITSTAAGEGNPDWQPLPTVATCVFGPTVYTRGKGTPVRVTQQITATPGNYVIDLDDLASSGADAVVKLNGVVILDGRGTTGETGPRHHMVTVRLTASNLLEVEVRGKKGSVLQVEICSAS